MYMQYIKAIYTFKVLSSNIYISDRKRENESFNLYNKQSIKSSIKEKHV